MKHIGTPGAGRWLMAAVATSWLVAGCTHEDVPLSEINAALTAEDLGLGEGDVADGDVCADGNIQILFPSQDLVAGSTFFASAGDTIEVAAVGAGGFLATVGVYGPRSADGSFPSKPLAQGVGSDTVAPGVDATALPAAGEYAIVVTSDGSLAGQWRYFDTELNAEPMAGCSIVGADPGL